MNPKLETQDLTYLLPPALSGLKLDQKLIPRIARDKALTDQLKEALPRVPTCHTVRLGDARKLVGVPPQSIHLVITSPPYWRLKDYERTRGQLGFIENYERFLSELDKVWARCFDALVPGGRLVCVVGDVCMSRRKNNGVHQVVPLHASLQTRFRDIGYANLAPIIWYKIANASLEASGNSGRFLGKPYEPNAVVKNDIEFILMQRKIGGYRTNISQAARILSTISVDEHRSWFQQIWSNVNGASTIDHPAPFPLELAHRLIRMFSFVGDTVLDPFLGSGTTALAAAMTGRNSIGFEVVPSYVELSAHRLTKAAKRLPAAKFVVRNGRGS